AMTKFYFSIDGHTLQVIEVEGTLTKLSKPYHRIPIHVAQRYSVIPTRLAKYENVSNFWIRAEIDKNSYGDLSSFKTWDSRKRMEVQMLDDEVFAILSYEKQYNNEQVKENSYPKTDGWSSMSIKNEIRDVSDKNEFDNILEGLCNHKEYMGNGSFTEDVEFGVTNENKNETIELLDMDPFDLKPYTCEKIPKNTTFYEMLMIVNMTTSESTKINTSTTSSQPSITSLTNAQPSI
ncbi:13095_t:CDS:1, partial [Acaulospora morrowiae]